MSVYPRGKKGVYYMDFIVLGQRVMRSTGKYTEKEALKVEREARDKVEEEVKAGIYGKEKLTLMTAFQRAYKERWKHTEDAAKVESKFKKICTILGSDLLVEELTDDHVTKLIDTLESKGCTLSTINRYLACLKTMLNMVVNDWKEMPLLKVRIKRYREDKGRIREITAEEERNLIKYFKQIQEDDMADLIPVLSDTGCRLSEILNLQYVDIDFKTNLIHIWKNKAKTPKSVPMTGRVQQIMKKRGEGVFKGLLKDYAEKRWIKARKHLKLENDDQFVMHAFRHTCASRLVKSGVPLRHVQQWLGHKTYATTERYAHMQPDSLKMAAMVLEERR